MEKTTSSLIMFQVLSDTRLRSGKTTPLILLFQVYSEVDTRISAYAVKNITQRVSKTHQRESKRGTADIVSSLSIRCSPSLWASHSGQTSLGSARIIILTRQRSKSNLQYEINMASRSATDTWPGFKTVSKQRLAHTQ